MIKTLQIKTLLIIVIFIGSGLFYQNAQAQCDVVDNSCDNVIVEKLLPHSDGSIYVEISGADYSGFCPPATLLHVNNVNFLRLESSNINFQAMAAFLRIAHEQQRPLQQIKFRRNQTPCTIIMVVSDLG